MRRHMTGCILGLCLCVNLTARLSTPLCDLYAARVFSRFQALPSFGLPVAELAFWALFGYGVLRPTTLTIRGRWSCLKRYFRNAALFFSLLLFGFVALWSPLYETTALRESLTGDALPLSSEALAGLCEELTARAVSLEVEREKGAFALPYALDDMLRLAGEAVARVSGKTVRAPKALRYPELFDALGIAGMYVPWTFESLINPNDTDVALPFTACHEAAHQAGWAREEEANYIAWLACAQGDAHFQYAGCLNILYYAMNMLRAEDHTRWLQCVAELPAPVCADFRALGGLNETDATGARKFQSEVTDAFLRVNGQREGAAQYDAVVPLVAALLRTERGNSDAFT